MLKPLVENWCPNAFVISFKVTPFLFFLTTLISIFVIVLSLVLISNMKLETDEAILGRKSKGALQSYHHQLVIGNMLSSYPLV